MGYDCVCIALEALLQLLLLLLLLLLLSLLALMTLAQHTPFLACWTLIGASRGGVQACGTVFAARAVRQFWLLSGMFVCRST